MLKGKGYFKWLGKGKKPPWKRDFQRLIREMWEYYDLYLDKSEGDLPYWSTEMASVGHLAIALGRMARKKKHYIAALEYTGPRSYDRPDIWIYFGKSGDILLEAKQAWISYQKKDRPVKIAVRNALEKIKEASKQLKRYQREEHSPIDAKVSLIFALLNFSCHEGSKKKCEKCNNPKKSHDELIERMKKVKEFLGQRISYWGYYLPVPGSYSYCDEERHCYPAVMIFGRFQRRFSDRGVRAEWH